MKIRKDKEVDEKTGLNGWLSPKGEFFDFPYGKHGEFAEVIIERYKIESIQDYKKENELAFGERLLTLQGYIELGCQYVGDDQSNSYIFFPRLFGCINEITKSQKSWMIKHRDRMTSIQQEFLDNYLLSMKYPMPTIKISNHT